ncbi:uncharacterized protein LOC115446365 isoform X2 [Manduca sexta]|uniref:uncharacterized protein LOC115446365 isoform X2 n=1 Tax=Manduca sexta TaxID=7130 RepID=UPI00189090F0|nr:uncharacterized protein LOC115446365 isoform X2 [Manduca sexta]
MHTPYEKAKLPLIFNTYRFPTDPVIKNKWIEVCRRGPKWVPTRTSTICSLHFEEIYFQPLKIRRLFEWAIPTLKISHTDRSVSPPPRPPTPPPTSDMLLSIPGLEPDDTLDFDNVDNANNSEEFIQEINGNEPLPLLSLSPTLEKMVPLDLDAEISTVQLENKELQTQLKNLNLW